MQIELDSIERLTKDIKQASFILSRHEARFLTDAYYSMQADRIRANNQVRALNESAEPNLVLQYLAQQRETLEAQVKRALDAYSASHPAGRWARSITGIGPVIAAGLLAHIDVTKAQTAGQVWSFCLPEGTPIATPAGYRAIDQFQVGDRVLAHDGTETAVVQTFAHDYVGEMITVRARGHLPLDLTTDHEVYVRKEDGTCDWVPAGELTTDMMVAIPKQMSGIAPETLQIGGHNRATGRQPLLGSALDVDADLAWFFGLFLADGSTTLYREGKYERGQSNITFANDDDQAIMDRAERIGKRFGGTCWTNNGPTSRQLCFGRTSVTRAFREWFGPHAAEKKIPAFVLGWKDTELLQAFAQGYGWGDGCNGYWGLGMSSSSEELILGMQRLAAKCGVVARANHTVRKETQGIIRGVTINQLPDRYILNLRPTDRDFSAGENSIYTNRRPIEDETFYWDYVLKVERRQVAMKVFNIQTTAGTYIAKNTAVHNCGLNPTAVWGKGQKRPWNARLKKLCYLIGESFTRVSAKESDIYGKIWRVRKDMEIARNEAGQFADQAKASLEQKNFGADTNARKAYEQGKLPDARIHLRAQRYAVKLFLSHFHHVLFENEFGTPPPKPYIFSRPEHTHFMAPPNWPLVSEKCKSTEYTE